MAWDCRKLWNVRRGFLDVIKACRSHFCGPIKGSPSSSHSFNFEVLVLPCYLFGGSHTDTKIYTQYTIQSTPDVIIHIDIHIHVRPHKLWRPHCDVTWMMVKRGKYPNMSELFRLVDESLMYLDKLIYMLIYILCFYRL